MQEFRARPYQDYCINAIVNHPAIGLFLDMGLGKTVSTLTAIKELKYYQFAVHKVLVIAPLKVAETTWTDEMEKWAHLHSLRASKILGTVKERKAAINAQADVYIINRENVTWLVDYLQHDWPFDMVVIDESSSFKSWKAKRTKSLMRIRPRIARVVALTGTPSPKGLEDLWSQVYLLDEGERLGKNITAYRTRYFDRIPTYWGAEYRPKDGAREAITKKLSDICISMKSEDYIQLPPMLDNDVFISLDAKALSAYKKMERGQVLELDEETITAASAASVTQKLLQLSGGAIYGEDGSWTEIHQAKIDRLLEMLEALQGEPVLLFYSFVHEKDRIIAALEKAKISYKTLDSPEVIREWNAGQVDVLLAHPASAAYGLNLQAGGHHIIWFGLTWNYEQYVQANKRLHRSGQTEPVIIHRLICKGTKDEDVIAALRLKDKGQAYIMNQLKVEIQKAKEN